MSKPDREKAKELYINSKGNMALIEIAEQLNRPPGTVRGWKSKDKWDSFLDGTLQQKTERSKNKKSTINSGGEKNKKRDKKIVEEVVANEELTDKQQLFCIYYLKYFNATKAYQKAYGGDYLTANKLSYRLMVNDGVKQQIEKLKKERIEGIYLDGKDILQKYIDIAFADINDFMEFGQEEVPIRDDQGNPLIDGNGEEITVIRNYVNFKNSHEVDGTIISEVSKGKDGVKIKLQDKMKALDFLASHIGLLSQIDKAKIENEKAKTEKLQVEIDNMKGEEVGKETEDWVKAIEQIAAKRRGKDG